ncbi:MAG TPA: RDD family protein [Flavisolibacter sp.]|nr:RDD family protein [Flavisolibacter sp.]
MAVIRVTTNFNIDLEFDAAPFYKRLLAWVIDTVVLLIYIVVAVKFLNWLDRKSGQETIWALFMLLIIPYLTYHLVCETTMNGQSIGKRIMRIRVVNENGGQPGIGQYVIRWLIRTSDYMVVVIMLFAPMAARAGDFSFLWKIGIPLGLLFTDLILVNSRKQQRLGDLLAHTLVISTTQKQSISDTVFLDVEQTYVPSFPQVMQLSDRDINALKGILDTAKKRHDYNLAEMATEKIKSHLKIDTTLSPYDFLETLLKDYNYLSAN